MEEQLLAAIAAEPDSDEPRLVYADWLIAQGDPRGEQIMQVHRGAPGLAASVHRDIVRELRTGPMQDEVIARIRVGFVDRLKITKSAFLALREHPEWLDAPALRFVRELDLAIIDPDAWNVIRGWRHRGSIRRLEHGSKDKRIADGNLEAIATLLPQLTSVKLTAPAYLTLGQLDGLPLEAFELEVRQLDETTLPEVFGRPWKLRMLGLRTWQTAGSVELLAPVLRGDIFAGVRELELVGWKASEVVAALVASGRIATIETLRMEWTLVPSSELVRFRDALAPVKMELPRLSRYRPTLPFACLLAELGRFDDAVRELPPAHTNSPDYIRTLARMVGALGRRDRVGELLVAIEYDHASTVVATEVLLDGPLAGDAEISLRRARALATLGERDAASALAHVPPSEATSLVRAVAAELAGAPPEPLEPATPLYCALAAFLRGQHAVEVEPVTDRDLARLAIVAAICDNDQPLARARLEALAASGLCGPTHLDVVLVCQHRARRLDRDRQELVRRIWSHHNSRDLLGSDTWLNRSP